MFRGLNVGLRDLEFRGLGALGLRVQGFKHPWFWRASGVFCSTGSTLHALRLIVLTSCEKQQKLQIADAGKGPCTKPLTLRMQDNHRYRSLYRYP